MAHSAEEMIRFLAQSCPQLEQVKLRGDIPLIDDDPMVPMVSA